MSVTPTRFIKLYGIFIRPHLKYSFKAWWPWLKKDINLLEDVQMRSYKLVKGLQDIQYEKGPKFPMASGRAFSGRTSSRWLTPLDCEEIH